MNSNENEVIDVDDDSDEEIDPSLPGGQPGTSAKQELSVFRLTTKVEWQLCE